MWTNLVGRNRITGRIKGNRKSKWRNQTRILKHCTTNLTWNLKTLTIQFMVCIHHEWGTQTCLLSFVLWHKYQRSFQIFCWIGSRIHYRNFMQGFNDERCMIQYINVREIYHYSWGPPPPIPFPALMISSTRSNCWAKVGAMFNHWRFIT